LSNDGCLDGRSVEMAAQVHHPLSGTTEPADSGEVRIIRRSRQRF
jgi:hypothetical protein